jgi:hypothetical protein
MWGIITAMSKSVKWTIFWSGLLLVAVTSFSFGYLLGKGSPTPIIIEKCSECPQSE